MKWIYRFFVLLGIIFFMILVALAYFVIADPYNIRPLLSGMYDTSESAMVPDSSTVETEVRADNATEAQVPEVNIVSEKQAQALEAVGMDAGSVPAQFTPEQIACFVEILGQARVDAIVAGDTPTPTEFFKAKNCL